MWVFTKRGFYSIVKHNAQPDHFLVRARVRQDLVDLIDSFDGDPSAIEEDPKADYRWRVVLPTITVAAYIGSEIAGIDYTTSVKTALDKGEHKRHAAMMRVWTAMMTLQEAGGRYSGAGASTYEGSTLASLVGTRPAYTPRDWHWDDDAPEDDLDDIFFDGDAEDFVSVDRAHVDLDESSDLWEVNVWTAVGKPTTVSSFRDINDAHALADAIRESAESWGICR